MTTEDNAAAQRALYGAPLGELCHEVMHAFALTQAGLAGVLGISAPMLSQLMSARRVKIGNPAAVRRLHELLDLVPAAATMSALDRDDRLAAIREHSADLTTTRTASLTEQLRLLAAPDDLRTAATAVPGTPLARLLLAAASG